jgi:hypothetical protein
MRTAGKKPAVATANQAAAKSNLGAKLAALELAAENCRRKGATDGKASEECESWGGTLDFAVPKTLRQFNRWEFDEVSAKKSGLAGALRTNSQDTLRKYPALRSQIESAIELLGQLEQKVDAQMKDSSSVKLKHLLKYADRKTQALERELVELRAKEIKQSRLLGAANRYNEKLKKVIADNIRGIPVELHDDVTALLENVVQMNPRR